MLIPDPRILTRLTDAKNNIERALKMENITQHDEMFRDYVNRASIFLKEARLLMGTNE